MAFRWRRWAPAVVLGWAALWAPAVARANDATAERLYEEGRRAAEQGNWPLACDRFRESQERESAPGTLLNLANCEENRGQLHEALAHFRQAAQMFRTGDERIAYAQQRAGTVERKLAETEHDAPPSAGAPPASPEPAASSIPHAAPATPGGTPAVVAVLPSAVPRNAPVPPRDRADDDGRGMRTAGWIGLGLGAAGLVLGSIAGLETLGAKNTSDAHCKAGCDPTGLSAESRGKTWSTVSTVSVIAGGAFVAAGVSLLLVAPSRTSSIAAQATAGGAALLYRTSF